MNEVQPKAMLFGAYFLSRGAANESVSASASGAQTRAGVEEGGPGSGPHKGGGKMTTKYSNGQIAMRTPHTVDEAKQLLDEMDDHVKSAQASQVSGSAFSSEPYDHAIKQQARAVSMAKNVLDSTRSHGAQLQSAGRMESAKGSSLRFLGKLREADSALSPGAPSGRRFRTILLQEGMGNLVDCYYYTRQAIESCPAIFEGKKLYIDHPSESEEEDLPERSVTEIAGWFENCAVETGQGGQAMLVADAVLLNSPDIEPIRARMLQALEYSKTHPDQDLVGLSINAGGQFETMPLDQFMRTSVIPAGCMPKLQEAAEQGIQLIRPVSLMTAAKSCDLVTEAGAGGRISQLLERERGTMAKEKGKEADPKENKEAGHKEDGAGSPPAKDGAAQGETGDHPDAEKDQELIQSLMKKYLGDGFTDDDKAMAQEAYQNAMEMGMEGDEAMKCAGYNLKMAKHMQARQAKAGAGAPPPAQGAPAQESGGEGFVSAKAGPAPAHVPANQQKESEESEEASTKESNRGKRELALSAENARLKAQLDQIELQKFIDKTLLESKLPNRATKSFRECIKGAKTQKEVTEKFSIFQEAYRTGAEGDGMDGLFIAPEKTVSQGNSGTLDFSDCTTE